MLADWLADRALEAERAALQRHCHSDGLAAELWLRAAEFAEDVRLWIDRHGGWRELRRARRVSRARRGGSDHPKFHSEALP